MREGHVARASVRLRPEHSFPVLRKAARRNIGNAIHSAGCPFDPSALDESGQHRIRETSLTGLVCRQQAVLVLGKCYEFVKA